MSVAASLVEAVHVRHADAAHLALGGRWGKRWQTREARRARVYVQRRGSATLEVGGARHVLAPGDLAFLPRASVHVIRDEASTAIAEDGSCPGMHQVALSAWENESPVSSSLLVADLAVDGRGPWLALLPELVRITPATHRTARWLGESLELLEGMLDVSTRHAVATSFGRMLYTHALEALPDEGDVVRDAALLDVLVAVRRRPEHPWELAALARRAGVSRSVFAARATALLGMPLGRFVRELRLRRACELLKATDAGVKEVAREVGYASEPAFARAFTKALGSSPARFRARARAAGAVLRR